MDPDEEFRTLWVGGLVADKVDEDLLYELMLNAGPVESVRIPKGRQFGFVKFVHPEAVPYAVELFGHDTKLFGGYLRLQNKALGLGINNGYRPNPAPNPQYQPNPAPVMAPQGFMVTNNGFTVPANLPPPPVENFRGRDDRRDHHRDDNRSRSRSQGGFGRDRGYDSGRHRGGGGGGGGGRRDQSWDGRSRHQRNDYNKRR